MKGNYKILGRQVPVQVVKDYFSKRMAPAEPTEEQFQAWAARIPYEESMRVLDYYARTAAVASIEELPDDALALSGSDLDTIDRAVCMMSGA